MADPADYDKRAKRNARLADACPTDPPDLHDWEIVLRFYSALHLVEGYLRTKDSRFWTDNHGDRAKRIRKSPEIRAARAAYKNLYDLSVDVRYDPLYAPPHDAFAKAKEWASKIEQVVGTKLRARLTKAAAP